MKDRLNNLMNKIKHMSDKDIDCLILYVEFLRIKRNPKGVCSNKKCEHYQFKEDNKCKYFNCIKACDTLKNKRIDKIKKDRKANEVDLEIMSFRTPHQGGNENYAGVRIIHKPSGIDVRYGEYSNWFCNKTAAIKILKDKLKTLDK